MRLVVHAGLPIGIDAYTQEIGRAGRDGKKARAVLLYAPSDEYVVKTLSTAAATLKPFPAVKNV